MHIRDGKVVITGAIVVLICHIHRGVDEGRFNKRCTGANAVFLLVVIANDSHAACGNRVGHGCAAHVFVIVVIGHAPAIPLVDAILRVDRITFIALLIQVGIGGENPCAGRDHIGFDAVVVCVAAARPGSHLAAVAGSYITGEGVGWEAIWITLSPRAEEIMTTHTVTSLPALIGIL